MMRTIRDAESPVEARRALKLGFGFSGRQAAILLTLPVLSFTRSERERLHESRRARMDLLADVTGAIPVIREPAAPAVAPVAAGPSAESVAAEAVAPKWQPSAFEQPAPAAPAVTEWGVAFDGTLDRIRSVMDEHYGVASAGVSEVPSFAPAQNAVATQPEAVEPQHRRSARREVEEAALVLDEQIGELCDAIAESLAVGPTSPPAVRSDDPRDPASPTGKLLNSCGVDDATGIRTLLWHLRRTGLESVEALLPFAEPLTGPQGFEAQAVHFESAMASGGLGSEPGGGSTWAGRMWPIAERRGYGYAVLYRSGPGAGAVWAYGGGEPLHLLWDSVVDMLVDVYQALTAGQPCDDALAAVVDGRVLWSNLS